MRIKQAKLAQALRGETSNIIDDKKFVLEFDKGMLHAKLITNPKSIGPFIIFPANIAFIEYYDENEAPMAPAVTPAVQPAPSLVKVEKKPKK